MAELKDFYRLCKSYRYCSECPAFMYCTGGISDVKSNVEKLDAIVEQWLEEHPQKTYMQDFFERYPNAPRNLDGDPKACRKNLYGGSSCEGKSCKNCWREVMPDE